MICGFEKLVLTLQNISREFLGAAEWAKTENIERITIDKKESSTRVITIQSDDVFLSQFLDTIQIDSASNGHRNDRRAKATINRNYLSRFWFFERKEKIDK